MIEEKRTTGGEMMKKKKNKTACVLKGKNRSSKTAQYGFLFIAPSFLGIVLFVLVPFADTIRRSFFEAMSGKFVGFQNYHTVLNNDAFQQALSNTLKFIGVCIPLLLAVSLFLGVLLNSDKKNGSFFKTSFLIPLAIPIASVVLLWKVFFHENGLFNEILQFFGMTGYNWMHTEKAFSVLVFSYVWKNAGYDIILWLAGLSGIPQSYYEAAKVDGANKLQQFFYITLPELLPVIFVITVLSLLNSFKMFREAYLIAGDYPDKSIYMLQHLFNNWFVSLDIQKMCAAAVLVASGILVFILILQKFWAKEE